MSSPFQNRNPPPPPRPAMLPPPPPRLNVHPGIDGGSFQRPPLPTPPLPPPPPPSPTKQQQKYQENPILQHQTNPPLRPPPPQQPIQHGNGGVIENGNDQYHQNHHHNGQATTLSTTSPPVFSRYQQQHQSTMPQPPSASGLGISGSYATTTTSMSMQHESRVNHTTFAAPPQGLLNPPPPQQIIQQQQNPHFPPSSITSSTLQNHVIPPTRNNNGMPTTSQSMIPLQGMSTKDTLPSSTAASFANMRLTPPPPPPALRHNQPATTPVANQYHPPPNLPPQQQQQPHQQQWNSSVPPPRPTHMSIPPPPPQLRQDQRQHVQSSIPPSFSVEGRAPSLQQPLPYQPQPQMTSRQPPPPPPTQQQHPPPLQSNHAVQPPQAQQQQQQQQQQQYRPKIDPSQIPRPNLFTYPQQKSQPGGPNRLPIYYTRSSSVIQNKNDNTGVLSMAVVPPQANTRYRIVDDGYASPNVIRSTMYSIPFDRLTLSKTGDIPMGIVCTPFQVYSSDYVPLPRKRPLREQQIHYDGDEPYFEEEWNDPEAIPLILPPSTTDDSNNNKTKNNNYPLRCQSCAAYINVGFTDQGTCNFCSKGNRHLMNDIQMMKSTSLDGYSSTMPQQLGTVEYEVTGPYITRENGPVQPICLYAIDLTCPSIPEYVTILENVAHDMKIHFQRQSQSQQRGYHYQHPRIGICWFSANGIIIPVHRHLEHDNQDETFQGYNRGKLQYVIVGDITEEPFAPIPLHEWTFDLSDASDFDQYVSYLHQVVQRPHGDLMTLLYKEATRRTTTGNDGLELSCGGAALAFLSDALCETGGRGTIITWRRPNYGLGAIPYVEEQGFYKHPPIEDCRISIPLQNQTQFSHPEQSHAAKFYQNLQQKCTKQKIALDIVLCTTGIPSPYLDISTLSHLCKVTCGRLIWIKEDDNKWKWRLQKELLRSTEGFQGWDTVFKVRCSDGIRVKSYVSNCGSIANDDGGLGSLTASNELEMTCVTPNTCVAVELEHRVGGIPKDRNYVFIQTALLYTNIITGTRRVRVSTLAIKTTSIVNDIFKSIDFSAYTTYMIRSLVWKLLGDKLDGDNASDNNRRKVIREQIYYQMINILSNYRKNTPAGVNSPSTGQLILPEKMQLLPLFCMCILKSLMLRTTISQPQRKSGSSSLQRPLPTPTCDERSHYIYHMGMTVTPTTSMLMVHPYIYSIPYRLDNAQNTAIGQYFHNDTRDEMLLGYVHMPEIVPPSRNMIQDDGVYIIDDGISLYLYIGKNVPNDVQGALMEYIDQQHQDERDERIEASSLVLYLRHVLNFLLWQVRALSSVTHEDNEIRSTYPSITLIDDDMMIYYDRLLVHDPTMYGEKDYIDFLVQLYKQIK